ncbi:penicillin-binding protein 1C [Fibrella aquatilis]|uniref:peptidoglycan glycosyltransferase n=1 Tax=Fibrella aquatilis TaxID=2817059 RepID=A0A939JZ06_9BACT|nr:penicillin-binding protein 1C [Fibrella aquatilis]MBO0930923.1 penicillin-binding protein 1C [Fibrella aquatilis]
MINSSPFLNYIRTHRWPKVALAVLLGLFLLDRLFPPPLNVPYSSIVTAADSTTLHAFLSRDDKWRMYATLSEITPTLRQTILQKEDRWFRWHPGINPVAMVRALGRNLLSGKRTSGASTITMQVVRLLEPRPRTYGSKVMEVLRALQLELHLSKDEILQLYLNLVPYGGNIEGIKSASLLFFGKLPQLLSLAEITTLAIIPNRPSSLRLGENNAAVVTARNAWLNRFLAAGTFSQSAIDNALLEPLNAHRRPAPNVAPHLSLRLQSEHPDEPIIVSTLQANVQAAAERLVRQYVDRIRTQNIHNAAVLVINNQTGAIEAYVGSAAFDDIVDGGQVDGVRAIRSPGSALKPLLYALAFDQGLITPKAKINDVPTNFGAGSGSYEPDNYDRQFNGPVTAEFALANSLNIPAVKLLRDVSTPVFVAKLREAGFKTVQKQAPDLGLSMILGGCGVTLEELTRSYTAFASPQKLFSPEATFLVTNILTQITRPDLPNNFDNSYHLPRIAWKTGTSYGRRDAWSVGYNRHYTVGVWVGNFSGIGVPNLSGANTATPLLFQLFNAIDYNAPTGWFRPPTDGKLGFRQICPESGDVPEHSCAGRATDYYIMGVSRANRCQHQTQVYTNPAATISYCAHCRPAGMDSLTRPVARLYPNLAPEVVAWYAASHRPYAAIPPHNPACSRVFGNGVAPLITSLNEGSDYFIDPKSPADLALTCQTANDVQQVYWYLNNQLFRTAEPTETLFFRPTPGVLTVSCADDKGRVSKVRVVVKRG